MKPRKKTTIEMSWIPSISLIPIICFFLFIPIIAHASKDQTSASLRVELVHRHDPRLHGYQKQSLDRFERVKELAHRDMIRHRRRKVLETFEMPMHSGRDMGRGEYFVQVKVGTPSQRFWVIADTGSDLTWFNCNYNITKVRKHRSSSPRLRRKRVFSPHRSRTFRPVTCSSLECKVELSHMNSLRACPNASDPCLYDYGYLDGSEVMGSFGRDVFTVGLTDGRRGKLRNMVIGCTRSVIDGPTVNEEIDGLIGLGLSDNSFVSTAASQYGGKFSYCLVDHLSHQNISNFLTFGTVISKAKLLREIHTTPLIIVPPNYGVNVVGVSIDDQLLSIPQMVWDFDANGGVILDSGTSLTFLVTPAYQSVIDVLVRALVTFEQVKPFQPFDYCYSTNSSKGFNESLVPRLAFHFEGGVRFEPPVKSYVLDVGPGVKCIGIVETDWPGLSIIGNIMQQNHLWEFDLVHNTVGLAPSSCS